MRIGLRSCALAQAFAMGLALFVGTPGDAQVFTPTVRVPSQKQQPKPAPRPKTTPSPVVRAKPQPQRPVGSPIIGVGITDILLSRMGGTDTYTRSSVPGNSWGGEDWIITGGWGDRYDGFLRLDISSVPRLADEDRVTIRLFNKRPNGNGTPTNLKVYLADTRVTNQLTYAMPFTIDGSSEKWVAATGYDRWLEIDITGYVRAWQNGKPNNGVVLTPVSTNNNFNSFVSSESGLDPAHRPVVRFEIAPR